MRIRTALPRRLAAVAASGTLTAVLAVGMLASPTLAAKPSAGSSTSSLSVVMVIDQNGNGAPNWNDTITFAVHTSATTPVVNVNCSQGGVGVYTASAGFYPSYAWPATYRLSSTMWTSGAASCVATLSNYGSNGKYTKLATLSFAVGA